MKDSSHCTVHVSYLPELADAEALGNDLRRLMVRSENALFNNDARTHIEALERWIESYRRGIAAAQKLADNSYEMLHKARDTLRLSLEELYRLEDEGGNLATQEQNVQAEEIASTIRRIDKIMPSVTHAFHGEDDSRPETTH